MFDYFVKRSELGKVSPPLAKVLENVKVVSAQDLNALGCGDKWEQSPFIFEEHQDDTLQDEDSQMFRVSRDILFYKLLVQSCDGVLIRRQERLEPQVAALLLQDSRDFDAIHCKCCHCSFENAQGVYRHFIECHFPLNLWRLEERQTYGRPTFLTANNISQYNNELRKFLKNQTMSIVFMWKAKKLSDDLLFVANNDEEVVGPTKLKQNRFAFVTRSNIERKIHIDRIPLDNPGNIRPDDISVSLQGEPPTNEQLQKLTKMWQAHITYQHQQLLEFGGKTYTFVLIPQTNYLLEHNADPESVKQYLDDKSENADNPPTIVYKGEVAGDSKHSSNYHFHPLIHSGTVISFKETNVYTIVRISSARVPHNPTSTMSYHQQLLREETREALQLYLLASEGSANGWKSGRKFQLSQRVDKHIVRQFVDRDWLVEAMQIANEQGSSVFYTDSSSVAGTKLCTTKWMYYPDAMMTPHNKLPHSVCGICQAVFGSSSRLELHVLTHKSPIKTVKELKELQVTSIEQLLSYPSSRNSADLREAYADRIIQLANAGKEKTSRYCVYFLLIDNNNTNVDLSSLYTELRLFLKTGKDSSGNPYRFSFYVGKATKNSLGPSEYHLQLDHCQLQRLGKFVYILHVIECTTVTSMEALESVFLLMNKVWKQCGTPQVHFVNEAINYGVMKDVMSDKEIADVVIAAGSKVPLFCPDQGCEEHDDSPRYNHLHIDEKNLKSFIIPREPVQDDNDASSSSSAQHQGLGEIAQQLAAGQLDAWPTTHFFAVLEQPRDVDDEDGGEEEELLFPNAYLKTGPALCEPCGKYFENEAALRQHYVNAHDKRRPSTVFGKSKGMHHLVKTPRLQPPLHLQQHQQVEYPCFDCEETFATKEDLLGHEIEKHQVVVRCAQCSKTFRRRTGFYKHVASQHLNCKAFFCSKCGRWNKKTARHICPAEAVDQEPPLKKSRQPVEYYLRPASETGLEFECEICHQRRGTELALAEHMKECHPDKLDKPFACTKCDKTFSKPSYLKLHIQNSHSDTTFTCKECGESFNTYSTRAFHIRKKHPKPGQDTLSCTKCDKTFPSQAKLKRHMQTHEPSQNLTCPRCNATGFKNQTSLDTHLYKKCPGRST